MKFSQLASANKPLKKEVDKTITGCLGTVASALEDLFDIILEEGDEKQLRMEEWRNTYHPHFDAWQRAAHISSAPTPKNQERE